MLTYRLMPPDSYLASITGGYFETGGLTPWTLKLTVSGAAGAGWTLDAKVQKAPYESDAVSSDLAVFAQVTPVTGLPHTDTPGPAAIAVSDLFLRAVWTVGGAPAMLVGAIEASAVLFDVADAAHLNRLSRQLRDADDKQDYVDGAERAILRRLRPSVVTRLQYGQSSPEPLGYIPRFLRPPLAPDSGALAMFLNQPGAVDAIRDAIAAQATLNYDRWRLMGGNGNNALDRQTSANMPKVAEEVMGMLTPFMRPNVSGWAGR